MSLVSEMGYVRFIFIIMIIVLFQIGIMSLVFTSDMRKSGFGDKISSIGLKEELTDCQSATESLIESGRVMRQDAAIRFSNLSCMLAKRQ